MNNRLYAMTDTKRLLPYPVLSFAIAAYLLPGILGHDPWKQNETDTFGIIYHMLTSGDWGIPVNVKPGQELWPGFHGARAAA